MTPIQCTECHEPISPANYNTPDLIRCPSCGAPLNVFVFTALLKEEDAGSAAENLLDDQAGCFYHPQKKAVVSCAYCGRFLCSLCDVAWDGSHLCPVCLDKGKKKGRIVNLERHRVLYDALALKLAIYPVVMFWFTICTAPAALYIAIRHWNSPGSIVGRIRKLRLVSAVILSSLQILGWGLGIAFFVSRR